ncbi:MAG TPA: hypothetical protein PLU50_05170, partial [Pseudobdellovibrionaceae bacterium]|nr:hypothetical protein [Pseudobdellovibrionaceae bacterium]
MNSQSRFNLYIIFISGLLMFASSSVVAQDRAVLQSALGQIDRGQYAAGAATLFTLSNRPEYANDRPQIKYILGMALMRLNMPQVAAFQFVDVIRTRDAKYTRMAVEKLSLVADELGDDTILSYVLNQIHLNEVPANEKDMVLYRLGEAKLAADDFASAIDLLSKVAPESSYYELAQVKRGLAQMESGRVDDAIVTFKGMIAHRPKASPNDENMVAARMGIARALYQKKSWDAAIEAYSLIPRDSLEWHNAVYEKAWAMVQAVRFRSAMGLFQTMHSAFYEDHYNPESLLLRAIVYLYICKYDELDKVISLFEKS